MRAGGAGRRALNWAVQRLHGRREVCDEFSLAGRTDLDNFRLALTRALDRAPRARETAAVETAYLRRLPCEVERSVAEGLYELVPGVERLLGALRRRPEVLVGLGTGNIESGARIKLGPSGLVEHFSFGGFGGDGYARVSVLRAAVRRAALATGGPLDLGAVFVIGDTEKDVAAGKEAGYRTGAVTCGFGDARRLRQAKPDLLAEDFRDLSRWLRWIGLPGDANGQRPTSHR